MSDTALKHIEHLSLTIGPRGSATPKEKEAHDYVQAILNDLGCNPRVEMFQAATSAYLPFVLGLGVMLAAEALFWLLSPGPNAGVGALAAAVLGVLTLLSLVRELGLADNPLRWALPVAPSQNVTGVTPPTGETRHKVVVMAHVDSHRTPLIWTSRNTFLAYRLLSALAFLSLLALCAIFVFSLFTPSPGLRTASLVPAGIVALALLVAAQGAFTPFTHGANDNASGVGVMLALAERLKQAPLTNTEVWWVATGCEEVGAYGSADFIRRNENALYDATVIVVDNIGGKGAGPTYLTSEGMLLPMRFSPDVLAIAEQVAAQHPEFQARPRDHQGVYTDAAPAVQANVKALSLVGYTPEGWIPNWHSASDVFGAVDAEAVDRTEQFVWEVLKKLDA
jgi:hypothetical protein